LTLTDLHNVSLQIQRHTNVHESWLNKALYNVKKLPNYGLYNVTIPNIDGDFQGQALSFAFMM